MEAPRDGTKTVAEMLSKAILEIVDNNAHLLTILDLQARVLAKLEARGPDEIVDEVNQMLKARRREALREIDRWVGGTGDIDFDDGAQA